MVYYEVRILYILVLSLVLFMQSLIIINEIFQLSFSLLKDKANFDNNNCQSMFQLKGNNYYSYFIYTYNNHVKNLLCT